MAVWLKLLAILVLVAGNAFFVASEIALTSVRRSRIKQLADAGDRAARVVQMLHSKPERFYSVTQIGITMVSLALGAIGMYTVAHLLDPTFEAVLQAIDHTSSQTQILAVAHKVSYVFGFLIISFFHVVGGELAPKLYAYHSAETLSLLVGRIINTLYRLFSWLIWIMNRTSQGLLWMFGQQDLVKQQGGVHFSMTEEEIRTILSASEHTGAIHPEETRMIRRVFDLDDHIVREAMIPRTDIVALPENAIVDDVLQLFQREHHTRFPIYRHDLDDIVGFVTMKELLGKLAQGETFDAVLKQPVSAIMLQPYLVPDTKPLSHLLREFRENSQYMAIILDEFGGTAGLITLEDILEGIVGEYDDEFTTRHRRVRKTGANEYLIDPAIHLVDLEEKLEFPFPHTDDYATLGGFIYAQLERVPEVDDQVQIDNATLIVQKMDKHRVTLVRLTKVVPGEGQAIHPTDGERR